MNMTIRSLMDHFKGVDITLVVVEQNTTGETELGRYDGLEDMITHESRELPDRKVKTWEVIETSDGLYMRMVVCKKKGVYP